MLGDADGRPGPSRLGGGHGLGRRRRIRVRDLRAAEGGERHDDENRNGGANACAAAVGGSMPDGHRRPPFGYLMTATDDGALVGVRFLPFPAHEPAVRARWLPTYWRRLIAQLRR